MVHFQANVSNFAGEQNSYHVVFSGTAFGATMRPRIWCQCSSDVWPLVSFSKSVPPFLGPFFGTANRPAIYNQISILNALRGPPGVGHRYVVLVAGIRGLALVEPLRVAIATWKESPSHKHGRNVHLSTPG